MQVYLNSLWLLIITILLNQCRSLMHIMSSLRLPSEFAMAFQTNTEHPPPYFFQMQHDNKADSKAKLSIRQRAAQ